VSAFALDPVYKDFAFTSGRMSLVTGATECAQKLESRFAFGKGEWFLDQNQGMPWFQAILGLKNPSLPAIESLARKIINDTPGVKRIAALTIAFDKTLRKLSITNVRIEHDSGAVIVGGRGTGFYVLAQNLSATPSVVA